MKYESYSVTFERTFTIRVLVPPGTGRSRVDQICRDMTFSNSAMEEWAGDEDWEAIVGPVEDVVEDDESLRYRLVRGRYREALDDNLLTEEDTFVLDDKGEHFVQPEDAAWCWSGEGDVGRVDRG